MNYGYEPTDKDDILAERIKKEVLGTFPPDTHGRKPYVEINCMYPGVRVRRITHYDEFMQRRLITEMDRIHKEVVGDES